MNASNFNAKDLMVGDWLQHANGKYYQVTRIDRLGDGNIHFACGFPHAWEYNNKFKPVTLTTEILEKNGFEDIGDDTYQLEEKPCWFWVDFFNHQYGCEYDTSTYEYEDDEHRLKLYGIPSVHELQHALRLCGIEKEIEL